MMQLHYEMDTRNEILRFAQTELTYYLDHLLGGTAEAQRMDIYLEVNSDEWDPVDDRYAICARASHIDIQGSNPRSVLLGVYRLLFELGCRFPRPGRAHEYVPQISLDSITVNLKESAAFRHRGVCIEGADSLENILAHIDWLPKIGCNSFFLQHLEPEAFLDNWYSHKYNPKLVPEELSNNRKQQIYQEINRAIACRGLLHHRGGHGWTSQAIGFHHACVRSGQKPSASVQRLLAEIDGRREYWNGVPSNTNLCYSEPDARRAFEETVVQYAQAHPNVDYLHVWLADEYNNICECEQCRATTPSDQYISLLNGIDAQLTVSGLSTHIVLLLYQELLWPPIKEKLNNPSRFTLMFAPISRTFSRSYSQRGSIPPIPPYVRNKIELPHSLEENIAFLEAWQKQCPLDSFIYDYPLGRAHYGDLGYHHIAQIIWQDIRGLRELGLNGYISCQELRAASPNAFPEYVIGRMLWNPSQSFETLEEEYYSVLYGVHWQEICSYLTTISKYSSCDYFNGIGPRQDPSMEDLWKQGELFVSRNYPHVRNLLHTQTPLQNQMVSLLDYHAKYCTLLMRALSALAAGDNQTANLHWINFMEYIRNAELDFQPYLDVYRVLEVATKYTGFSLDMPR